MNPRHAAVECKFMASLSAVNYILINFDTVDSHGVTRDYPSRDLRTTVERVEKLG